MRALSRKVRIRKKRKKTLIEERKSNFNSKKLHSVFFKETASVREEKESWLWLKDGYRDLKKETEGLILAAQEQAIRTNWIKRMRDKQDISQKCSMCRDADETVNHIVAECKYNAQKVKRTIKYQDTVS